MLQIRQRTPVKVDDDVDLGGFAYWDRPPDTIFAQSTDDLCRAIAQRREELGMTQDELDDLVGLPDGYTAKVESLRTYPVGLAFTLYLQTLGMVLVMHDLRKVSVIVERAAERARNRKPEMRKPKLPFACLEALESRRPLI